MKAFFSIIGVIIFIVALSWFGTAYDLFSYSFWAPKYAAVQRQVFTQTPSYQQGMIQELENMQFEYEQADAGHKAALATIILHRAGSYPNTLPPDLESFVNSLRQTTPTQY